MKPAILLIGVVLAVIGGALVIAPVTQVRAATIYGPQSPSSPFGMNLPYAIGDTILYNVSWTGGHANSTYVLAYGCGHNAKCASQLTLLAAEGGPSGAFTLGIAPGSYFVLNSTTEVNVTVSASMAGAYGLAGIGPLVMGVLLIAHGWLSYPAGTAARSASSKRLDSYLAAMTMLLIVLGMISGYVLTLGPLNSEGVESAFGFAVGIALLDIGLMFHILDVVYRDRSLEIRRQLH